MSIPASELTAGFRIRRAAQEDMERVGKIARQAWQRIHASTTEIMGEEMHAVLCANWEDEKTAAVRRHWEAHPEWFRVVVAHGDGDCRCVPDVFDRSEEIPGQNYEQCRCARSAGQGARYGDVSLRPGLLQV